MPAKRKLENFDPNKSDSNDTDFDPVEARPRKSAKKTRTKRSSGGGPRKRTKYRGSDVSDDDIDDSEVDEESFDDPEEEEEDFEMNEKTGRAVRKAAKKSVNYGEDSDSDVADLIGDDESDSDAPKRRNNKRSRDVSGSDDADSDNDVLTKRKTRIVKLKVDLTPKPPTRSTRAGSAVRTRGAASAEPTSAGGTRRLTRGRTADAEEPIALSTSGHHVIRASRSPEPIGRARATRGAKGMKLPASTIKEEVHETSSYEQDENAGKNTEIAGSDQEDPDDMPIVTSDLAHEADADGDKDDVADEGLAQAQMEIDDDSDDMPVTRTRASRASNAGIPAEGTEVSDSAPVDATGPPRRLTRGSKSKSKTRKAGGAEQSSDFEPVEDASEDELSASDAGAKRSNKAVDDDYDSSPKRGRGATQNKSKSSSRRRASDEDLELDEDELAEELQDLKSGNKRRPRRVDADIVYEIKGRRERKPVDYSIKPMDQIYAADEDGEDAAPTPTRRAKGGRSGASQPWERNLFTAFGPFGGGGGPAPVIGGPWGTGATGGVDSDSSDDENM